MKRVIDIFHKAAGSNASSVTVAEFEQLRKASQHPNENVQEQAFGALSCLKDTQFRDEAVVLVKSLRNHSNESFRRRSMLMSRRVGDPEWESDARAGLSASDPAFRESCELALQSKAGRETAK